MQPAKRRNSYAKLLWLIPVIAVLGFCYTHSMQPVGESREFTLNILTHLKQFLWQYFHLDLPLTNGRFRKIGHFMEFMVLGFFLYSAIKNIWSGIKFKAPLAFILAVIAASGDEALQIFADHRGSELRDVCIDSSGAFVGILGAWILFRIIQTIFHSPN